MKKRNRKLPAAFASRPPRIVTVTTQIIKTQERLTAIFKRLVALDTEGARLEEEREAQTNALHGFQRDMDKLTSVHHVVQQ